ncbi:MAG: response regulator transcription factor [Ardenticatenaceae bacterium]|nr:response regulator transcription factor [Anaerolineales bacterium]MCB9007981.1 response regulator transcription factor [Ardenticatenaceae bacterium]
MPEPIRVLLVDDQRLMRDGLRTLLELESDLDVVGEAADGQEAVQAYAEKRPDVVLMDIRMPVMTGVEATARLCHDWPEANIIILTTFDDDEYVFEGIRAGAKGYLLKDVSGDELATAVRAVAGGSALLGSSVAQRVLAQFASLGPAKSPAALPEPLSDRELEILQLIAQGLSNPEIAARLFLAEGTVKNYVSNILQKTDTRDRTQAVLKAQSLGLLNS